MEVIASHWKPLVDRTPHSHETAWTNPLFTPNMRCEPCNFSSVGIPPDSQLDLSAIAFYPADCFSLDIQIPTEKVLTVDNPLKIISSACLEDVWMTALVLLSTICVVAPFCLGQQSFGEFIFIQKGWLKRCFEQTEEMPFQMLPVCCYQWVLLQHAVNTAAHCS